MYSKNDIKLPKWIAERSYLLFTDESRTYINNELKHTSIELDGVSSDFWYLLVHGSEEEYRAFIDKFNLEDSVDDFVDELFCQGLLMVGSKKISEEATREEMDGFYTSSEENEGETAFNVERNRWLFSHGFMPNLFLELTYRCNLKCVHCYNPKHMSETEIPFEKIKQIVDDAFELGAFCVTVSGGESTTHTRFLDIIEYIRSKGMSLEIFTNGQLLATDEKYYQRVLDVFPHQIGLSLYSAKKDTHDKVTAVSGSCDKTKTAIEKLRKDHVLVNIKNFLLNFNCLDCIKVKKYAESLGANSQTDISLIPTIEGDKKTHKYVLSEGDLFSLFINEESPLFIGNNLDKFNFREINKNDFPCYAGFSGLTISPSLEVHPCVSLPLPLGDCGKESLKTIWQDATINKKSDSPLYKWLSVTIGDLKECYSHEYCKFCHYCPGMGYLENGFLERSDVACAQAKARKRAYEYLISKSTAEK